MSNEAPAAAGVAAPVLVLEEFTEAEERLIALTRRVAQCTIISNGRLGDSSIDALVCMLESIRENYARAVRFPYCFYPTGTTTSSQEP